MDSVTFLFSIVPCKTLSVIISRIEGVGHICTRKRGKKNFANLWLIQWKHYLSKDAVDLSPNNFY